MELITQVDIKGISDQLKETLLAMQTFVADPEMKKIVSNLDSATGRLDSNLRIIEGIMGGGKIQAIVESVERGIDETRQGVGDAREGIAEARRGLGEVRQGIGEARQGVGEVRKGFAEARQVIGETRQGVAEIRKLLATIETEVRELKAAEISGESRRLIEGLDRRTKLMTADLRQTTADVRDAAEGLQMLIDRLKENPSDLLFSQPLRDNRERGER
jgi:chromosome segregation ATPase